MALCLVRVIPAGDLELINGSPVAYKGKLFVRQKISQRLRFFLGEWFRDARLGVPYFRDVFVQNPNLDVIRALFKSTILSVQEVTSVTRLDLQYAPATRILAVEFTAFLGAGEVLDVRQPDPPFILNFNQQAA